MSRADTLASNDQTVHDMVLRGTPDQFDATKALATTEFVQRALGSYAGQTNFPGDISLTAADVGRLSNFPQLSVATLPPSKTVAPGGLIIIGSSLSGGVTVKSVAADTLTNVATIPGPFFIPVGTFGVFRRLLGGSGWSFDGGDAALQYSPMMANWATQPPFTANKTLATTEFVQRAIGNYGNVSILSLSAKLTNVYFGRVLLLNSGTSFTVTLPPSGTGVVGGVISIRNVGGADVALVPSDKDTMAVVATVAVPSVIIKAGSSIDVVLQGTNYFISGPAAFKLIPEFASSQGANGWKVDPSELLEQWGIIPAIPAGGSALVSFPVAFNIGAIGYSLASGGSGAGVPGVNVNNVSASQVRFWNQSNTASTQAGGYRVIGR